MSGDHDIRFQPEPVPKVRRTRKNQKIMDEYAIYQAIYDLETYCRHRPAGGHIWLQVESEDRATAPVIENALMVLQAAGVEIVRDKPKFPNIRIIYDKTNNPFFGKF